MANADFSRQQNRPTGGFDASSYRAAAPAEEEVRLTPFQQKLASLEKALPASGRCSPMARFTHRTL